MIEKILIPVDGTENFDETIEYVEQLGERGHTNLVLLHVPNSEAEIPAEALKQPATGHPLLSRLYETLTRDNWRVEARLRQGDPVEQIVQMAVKLPATLIVMATHGRSGLENIRDGSVTEQVVKQSPCPVFVMHSTVADTSGTHPEHLFRRMLVPLDGSDTSAAILPCVEKFARQHHTEVVLFHDDPRCNDEADNLHRREVLGQHGVALANAGISVRLDCSTYRQPIREILRRTDELDIDLVAMATHGNGGMRRPLEDSVTANVMRHANRPLLVWSSDPQCPH
jgi:nucleotide-binding universal stress UspA family protein